MYGGFQQQQFQRNQPQQHQQMQMQPFGGRQDPFSELEDMMMMSPFGMLGGRSRGPSGGLFGDMFGQMDSMMRSMDEQMRGGMSPGGGGMMMSSSSCGGGGGGGGYSCQTMVFSSSRGPDGQMRTEHFSSSAVGDTGGRMREVQQAYSNSDTGVDKMSFERQMDGRGRKAVKERSHTGEVRETDMYRGMNEDDYGQFEQEWNSRSSGLPQHARGMGRPMLNNSAGYPPSRYQQQPQLALPPHQQQYRQQYNSGRGNSWR
eukprot:TRINITY_DN2502_c0_g1_i1.p1 TRINITY_DN2502_c0_g1~~TRINITY_DN2502_c0_g1_i1.p1  ORF type:complete len:259 (-),score=70.57 TRINITY_DN2502_c0_g1_i1:197-973(-)